MKISSDERQLFVDSVRNVHKAVCTCRVRCRHGCRCRSRCALGSLCLIGIAGILALREFLIIHYHLCGIYFGAFAVGIAAGLDPTGNSDLDALPQIFQSS